MTLGPCGRVAPTCGPVQPPAAEGSVLAAPVAPPIQAAPIQIPIQPPNVSFVLTQDAGPVGSIIAVISPQGTETIRQVTGQTLPGATVVSVDLCNQDISRHNVSASRVRAEIILQEGYGLYSSATLNAVLAALQNKDVFTRVKKAIDAGGNVSIIVTAIFKKFTPLAASVILGAPQIALAILPAVADPKDLIAFGQKLMADGSVFALSERGSGADCATSLVVAATGSVKVDQIAVQ